ncbi:MAG: VWA domain-containing protein [Acidobacteria bacterium]|nr:VWA domain-containing protein [Acidobacteriota bacterium]
MRVSKAVGLSASLAALWALRVLATSAAGPLQQDQRFASSSGVTLVEVVAYVSDRNGRPISGLTREDFALEEDGVRQDITHFSLVELPRHSVSAAQTPAPSAASAAAPVVETAPAGNQNGSGRSYVIVLDAQHVDPLRTGSVKQQAKKFINTYVEAGDAVAVVTVGGPGNQSFTSDKARLIRAVEMFVGSKSRSAALNKIETVMRAADDGPPRDYETATKAADARTLFDSIRTICSSFGAVLGRRRSIILFSEGIELDMTDMIGATAANGGAPQSASTLASSYAAELLLSQRAMYDSARKNNVSLYTVDPRGTSIGEDNMMRAAGPPAGPSGRGTNSATPPPTRDFQQEVHRSQGTLRNFADQTGGFAVVNSTDFDRGFNRIVDANSTYYVLGYSPKNPVTNERYRKISVRVSRPGVSVSARPGYFPAGPEPPSASAPPVTLNLKGASPWMQTLLVSALPIPGLGIHIAGTPIGHRGQDQVVAVVVELQSADFRFTEDGDFIRNDIEVGFVAVDSDGKIRAGRASTGTLRLPKTERAAVSGGLRYVLEIPLPNQSYQIRVGAIESSGGTAGSAVLDLDLTSSRDSMAPAGIVVGVYGDSVPTAGEYPVMKSLLTAVPTASRRFSADQRLAVYVPFRGPLPKQGPPAAVIVTVRRPDGTVVFNSPATLAKSGNALGTSVHGTVIDLPLTGLAPGHYSLGVEVVNGGKAEGIAPISFEVSARR